MRSAEPAAEKQGAAGRMTRRSLRGLPRAVPSAGAALLTAALLALHLAERGGAERHWWSTLNLYLPQWLWALPALVLFAVALRWERRRAWAPLLPLAWVLGPLMGAQWHSPTAAPPTPASLRIVTYNLRTAWDSPAVDHELRRLDPDVICLQESGAPPQVPALVRSGWHLAGLSGCIIASRYPLAEVRVRSLRGGPEWRRYVRCRILTPGGAVTLYNLHLDTPREGLAALLRQGPRALPRFQAEAGARVFRAAAIAEELRQESGPVIVAGDFNAPPRSMVYRTLRGTGLVDAFTTAGRGYGYTYGHATLLRHSFVRIDHLLVDPDIQVQRCWTGSPDGSDHRPVIAELRLPAAR